MKNIYRNIQPAQFIVGVGSLVDLQIFRQRLLRQVAVFPKVTNFMFVHRKSPLAIIMD